MDSPDPDPAHRRRRPARQPAKSVHLGRRPGFRGRCDLERGRDAPAACPWLASLHHRRHVPSRRSLLRSDDPCGLGRQRRPERNRCRNRDSRAARSPARLVDRPIDRRNLGRTRHGATRGRVAEPDRLLNPHLEPGPCRGRSGFGMLCRVAGVDDPAASLVGRGGRGDGPGLSIASDGSGARRPDGRLLHRDPAFLCGR